MGPVEVVHACLNNWAERDLDAVMSWLHDDIRFTLHAAHGSLPLAGEANGKAELRPRLQFMLDAFEFLAYIVDAARETETAGVVRTSILYYYRHKATGLYLDGRFRHVARVENGLIKEIDEYHDAAALEAFMKLVAQG